MAVTIQHTQARDPGEQWSGLYYLVGGYFKVIPLPASTGRLHHRDKHKPGQDVQDDRRDRGLDSRQSGWLYWLNLWYD